MNTEHLHLHIHFPMYVYNTDPWFEQQQQMTKSQYNK